MEPTLTAQLEQVKFPPGGGRTKCRISIEPGDQEVQPTRQILLCIDVSPSMKGKKIRQAKKGAKEALSHLAPEDHVAVVKFARTGSLVVDPVQWGNANQRRVRSRIDSLSHSGSTNITGGLEKSREAFDQMPTGENVVKRIVLLSDGQPNRDPNASLLSLIPGVSTNIAGFEELASTFGSTGIAIQSAGIGASYGEEVMRVLGEASRGEWAHLSDPGEISQFFQQAIADAGTVVATDPVLKITPFRETEIIEVYRRRPRIGAVDPDRRDRTLAVELPDLEEGEPQELVVDIDATASAPEDEALIANLELSTGSTGVTEQITARYVGGGPEGTHRRMDVREAFDDAKARHLAVAESTRRAKTFLDEASAAYADTNALEDTWRAIERIEGSSTEIQSREARDDATRIDPQG